MLETISFWLIMQDQRGRENAFLHSSNEVAGNIINTTNNFFSYFSLKETNEMLVKENASLQEQLIQMNQRSKGQFITTDSSHNEQYTYIPAKVVNNSTHKFENFLTVNKGRIDGIEPGLGVVSPSGIVGVVKAVSDHFATITSALHTDLYISSELKKSSTFCSTKWNGKKASQSKVLFVPRHVNVSLGDTVITSGFNAIFPEGALIGFISKVDVKEDGAFYTIDISLATDFSSLPYVYIIKNSLKPERVSLETTADNE